ncbi:MAG: hypothetical protein MJ146_01285 [Clostridia bacterium]|nr:hypothetical protein [Clostridia bacterium]
MKGRLKKSVAMLLTVAMMFTACSFTAFAVEGPVLEPVVKVELQEDAPGVFEQLALEVKQIIEQYQNNPTELYNALVAKVQPYLIAIATDEKVMDVVNSVKDKALTIVNDLKDGKLDKDALGKLVTDIQNDLENIYKEADSIIKTAKKVENVQAKVDNIKKATTTQAKVKAVVELVKDPDFQDVAVKAVKNVVKQAVNYVKESLGKLFKVKK